VLPALAALPDVGRTTHARSRPRNGAFARRGFPRASVASPQGSDPAGPEAKEQVGPTGTVAGLDLDAGTVTVARATTPAGLGIEWHEASAEAVPLPDEAFDVVLCQLGLQFVSDKVVALAEMHRVLAPGGRALVAAPGPTPALFEIFEDALARHLGGEAAMFVTAVLSLHDPAELERLMTAAGFADVITEQHPKPLHVPLPADFMWPYVHSTPLAGPTAQPDEDTRRAIQDEVVAAWQPYVDDGGVRFEVGMLTATGHEG
jgi:SAM-dependent methyltransferase